jgi:hypothetical protein
MYLRQGVLVACLLAGCEALEAKWTPNGEAPAPFSTKARQEMGMDPAAFAGQAQAPLVPPGAGLPFSLGCLVSDCARHEPV